MIKLKSLLIENSKIDKDKLFWNPLYLDGIAKKLKYNFDFTKQFWLNPQTLFHCTSEVNYEKIKNDDVLNMMNGSRGITNKNVGRCIFTTSETEEINFFKSYYGPIVLSINTTQMKRDGFTPEVEREPDWENAIKLSFVLSKIENEYIEPSRFVDSSEQNTEYTVIVYDDIPIKYLSVVKI